MDEKQTIFDFLNSINEKKRIEINKKDFSGYMVSLWLSHASDCIEVVNRINPFIFNMPSEAIYEYYFDKISKKKRFIKFTKKEKNEKESTNKESLKTKYNLSKKEIKLFKDFF
jgi:hypothetical protein